MFFFSGKTGISSVSGISFFFYYNTVVDERHYKRSCMFTDIDINFSFLVFHARLTHYTLISFSVQCGIILIYPYSFNHHNLLEKALSDL